MMNLTHDEETALLRKIIKRTRDTITTTMRKRGPQHEKFQRLIELEREATVLHRALDRAFAAQQEATS